MNFFRTVLSTSAVALLAFASSAHSATVATVASCTDSVRTDDLSLNPSYLSCTGSFSGNTTDTTLNFGGVDYAFIGKTGNDGLGAGPFQSFGADFTTGTLTFDQAWTGTFILGLKAANSYSLYKFSSTGPVSSITFDTLGVSLNAKGIPNGLSHAALWGGEAVPSVPEPETYALLLAGLGAVGFVARRRKQTN